MVNWDVLLLVIKEIKITLFKNDSILKSLYCMETMHCPLFDLRCIRRNTEYKALHNVAFYCQYYFTQLSEQRNIFMPITISLYR